MNKTKFEVKFEQKDLVTKVYEIKLDISNDTTLVDISKTDITGDKELVGAKLTITDKDNKVIDSWVSTEKTHKIEGLTIGKEYTLTEEIAPEGYVIATSIKFTINDTNKVQKVNMKDKIVTMSKVDIGGEEVEGAKIQIIDKDGNIIDEWLSSKEEHKIKNLKENETYTLHEETAPDGFVKITDVTFKVTDKKENQHIDVVDKVVIISKQNIGGEEIKGAKLQVLDSEGNIIDEWISEKESHKVSGDADSKEKILDKFTFGLYEDAECTKLIQQADSNKEEGTIVFKDLRYGIYYVKEISAPKGYQKSDKIVKIEINDKGIFVDDNQIEKDENEIYSFEFEDHLIETPKTGDEGHIRIWLAVLGLSIIALLRAAVFGKSY